MWSQNVFVIVRFPLYGEPAQTFEWPGWLSDIAINPEYEGGKRKEDGGHRDKVNLRDGVSIRGLPISFNAEGLVCKRAFRYWFRSEVEDDNRLYASVLFMFNSATDDGVEENEIGKHAFGMLCRRRAFQRAGIYRGYGDDSTSIVLMAPVRLISHETRKPLKLDLAWTIYALEGGIVHTRRLPHW